MPANHADDINRVLSALSETLPRFDNEALRVFLAELFHWNPQLGLVSKRETPVVVARLLRQSVRLWDFVSNTAGGSRRKSPWHIIDIGTGGGVPGLVWKLLVPELDVILLERKERKVAFLERVVARVGLKGIAPVAADLREIASRDAYRDRFDLAVLMAVTDPAKLSHAIESVLVDHGLFATIRGRDGREPGERLGRSLEKKASFEAEDARLFLFEKTTATG